MKQVVIENPVINSPFDEPRRHFRFSDEGITNEIVSERRTSSYFIPIATPRKKGKKQLFFDTEWTQDRIEENKFINQVRARVKQWRENKHFGVSQVFAYVKNQNPGFTVPYNLDGEEHNSYPDFIARIDDGHGPDDLLNLVLECTGGKKKDKDAKVSTVKTLWLPAVNHHGEFGRWMFLEIEDPWDAGHTVRQAIQANALC